MENTLKNELINYRTHFYLGPTKTANRYGQRNTITCCESSYFPGIFCAFLGLVFFVCSFVCLLGLVWFGVFVMVLWVFCF